MKICKEHALNIDSMMSICWLKSFELQPIILAASKINVLYKIIVYFYIDNPVKTLKNKYVKANFRNRDSIEVMGRTVEIAEVNSIIGLIRTKLIELRYYGKHSGIYYFTKASRSL